MASGKALMCSTHSRHPDPDSCPCPPPEGHPPRARPKAPALLKASPAHEALVPLGGLSQPGAVLWEARWLPETPNNKPKQHKKVGPYSSCLLLGLCGELAPGPASTGPQVPWYLLSVRLPGALLPPLIKTQVMALGPPGNPGSSPTSGTSRNPYLQSAPSA